MSTTDNGTSGFRQLFSEVKEYLELRAEYAKLEAMEKLTMLISGLLLIFVLIFLGMTTLLYLSFALAYLLEPLVGSLPLSFVIVAGISLLLITLVVFFRKSLIVQPMLRFLARLFLNNSNK